MATIKDRIYARSAAKRIPLTGAFELSPICNFSCKMCYVRKSASEVNEKGGLKPLDFWLDIAQQAREAGTLFPLLTGGETFLYPYIRELFEAMCKMGMQVSINSNASCITKDIVKWLKLSPPERINITLYGGSNESYERLCGDPNGFDKVKNAVKLLADNDIRFKFNCSLTPDNKDDLEKMLAFAKEYGQGIKLATYMFPPVRRTGECGDYQGRFTPKQAAYYQVLNDWYQLSTEDFQRLAKNAQNYIELTPELIDEAANKPTREMGCLAGRCSYWVDWQGNLSGCGMIDFPQVSLKDHSLIDAWKEIVDWTNDMRYSSICANCVNRTVCHSCAAMVHNETGSFDGRPIYLCEMRKYAAQYYKEFAEKQHEENVFQSNVYETCHDLGCVIDNN